MNKIIETKFTKEELQENIEHLEDPASYTRRRARWDLVLAGAESIPMLEEVVRHNESVLARKEAVKALGEIQDPLAVPILVSALEDHSYDVRWDAAVGLIEHCEDSLIPLFEALKTDFGSPVLREGAHHVLRVLRKKMANQQVEDVYAALESSAPAVRLPWAVNRALEELYAVA
jgi:HEAT repeat protein